MCARYTREKQVGEWLETLHVDPAGLFARIEERDTGPRWNITPGTRGWIATVDADGELALDEHLWAFPTSRGNRINVRSETAHRVPEYREHYDHHRCVVLASGFYEPKGAKTLKNRPWFYFRPRDGAPLFLGAIAKPEGFSILTRAPVAPVAEVHDRSPVLVPADNVLEWLDPEVPGREALSRFAPAEFGGMLEGWHVSDAAKRPGNEGPALIERVPTEP